MERNLEPFRYMVYDNGIEASILLTNFEEKEHIFAEKASEGWEGGGYDWASLAVVILAEKAPHLQEKIQFDPEASMFAAYGKKEDVLEFAQVLYQAYQNDDILRDALTRAELD